MRIRGREDLKVAYYIINACNGKGKDDPHLRDIKRAVREYLDDADKTRKVIKADYDYCVELVILGDDTGETLKEVDDYFRETEYLPMVYSAYDCTGRMFTEWYKIFKRRGCWMAYHCVGRDV